MCTVHTTPLKLSHLQFSCNFSIHLYHHIHTIKLMQTMSLHSCSIHTIATDMKPHLCQSICTALLRLPLKHLICVAVFMLQNRPQSIFAATFMLPSCCCIFCNLPQLLCSSICHSSHVTASVQPLSSISASSVQLSVFYATTLKGPHSCSPHTDASGFTQQHL